MAIINFLAAIGDWKWVDKRHRSIYSISHWFRTPKKKKKKKPNSLINKCRHHQVSACIQRNMFAVNKFAKSFVSCEYVRTRSRADCCVEFILFSPDPLYSLRCLSSTHFVRLFVYSVNCSILCSVTKICRDFFYFTIINLVVSQMPFKRYCFFFLRFLLLLLPAPYIDVVVGIVRSLSFARFVSIKRKGNKKSIKLIWCGFFYWNFFMAITCKHLRHFKWNVSNENNAMEA